MQRIVGKMLQCDRQVTEIMLVWCGFCDEIHASKWYSASLYWHTWNILQFLCLTCVCAHCVCNEGKTGLYTFTSSLTAIIHKGQLFKPHIFISLMWIASVTDNHDVVKFLNWKSLNCINKRLLVRFDVI